MSLQLSIALIGFGEAASTFAEAGKWEADVRGYDIDRSRRKAMEECGVIACGSAADALAQADLVLSLVTADAALDAARMYGPHIKSGAQWCDMNSVAPQTKLDAAHPIEAAGGRYVDVAVMAPVRPARLDVPLLAAGPHASEARDALTLLGFGNCHLAGDQIGRAAAIKLCRSIMVKGMEALTAEMVLNASKHGVLPEVFASLNASEKTQDWHARADYALDRMLTHGMRRSAEMRETVQMLSDEGLSPLMSEAIAQWQESLGKLDFEAPDGLEAKLIAILTALENGGST